MEEFLSPELSSQDKFNFRACWDVGPQLAAATKKPSKQNQQ